MKRTQGQKNRHMLKVSPQGKAIEAYRKKVREKQKLINWKVAK